MTALALSLSNAGDEQNLTPAGWDSSRAGAYALSFVAVVFAAPITEELLYRGLGLSLLLARTTVPVAVGVTAILFGLGHGLVGVSERVKIYGGEMNAGTAPEGGFVLSARLPVEGRRR